MQSPLSFGGLAALLRHIPRLTDGMEDALLNDFLDRECLASLNQYQPALSASWLFQKCMSVSPVSVRSRGRGGRGKTGSLVSGEDCSALFMHTHVKPL